MAAAAASRPATTQPSRYLDFNHWNAEYRNVEFDAIYYLFDLDMRAKTPVMQGLKDRLKGIFKDATKNCDNLYKEATAAIPETPMTTTEKTTCEKEILCLQAVISAFEEGVIESGLVDKLRENQLLEEDRLEAYQEAFIITDKKESKGDKIYVVVRQVSYASLLADLGVLNTYISEMGKALTSIDVANETLMRTRGAMSQLSLDGGVLNQKVTDAIAQVEVLRKRFFRPYENLQTDLRGKIEHLYERPLQRAKDYLDLYTNKIENASMMSQVTGQFSAVVSERPRYWDALDSMFEALELSNPYQEELDALRSSS